MPLIPYRHFHRALQACQADHPETAWHLHGCERRIYAALRELDRYFPDGCRLLDFGCLPANLAIGLKAAGRLDRYRYTGICSESPDSPGYRFAREQLQLDLAPVNLDGRFHLFEPVSALPQRCPVEDGCADCVVATEILEHLVWPHSMLAEAARVLRPGGLLIGSTPNATNIGVIGKSILGRGAFESYSDSHLTSETWMKHVRFYSGRDLRALLNDHPFDPVRIEYHTYWHLYPNPTGRQRIVKYGRGLFYLVPHWRENLFFAARRR